MEDRDIKFIISGMTYSFSRLNSFYNGCRLSWYKNYIECCEKAGSFDGEFGSFCHSLLQWYFEGKMTEFELAPYYEQNYSKEVTTPCPYPGGDSKYQKGLEYFQNFSFNKDKYEILGVEKEVRFKLNDEYDIVGYIDLLYRDKETGEITLQDHKSGKIRIKKNGEVSKSDAEHWISFQRQQYLYSYVVLKEYGRVDHLKWNLFNQQEEIEIDWKEEEMNETLDWAYKTIKSIESETEYPADPDYYFCQNLCDARLGGCVYKRLGMIYDGIYSKCYKEKNKDYFEYGGMGITMCDEWRDDKQAFFKWALESDYADDKILKRYDEEQGFDFFNCYWDYRPIAEDYGYVPE